MANKKILKNNLYPINKKDLSKWREFLDSLDETTLWFPEGECRFDMLNWFTGGEVELYPIPSLCIYTGHLPQEQLNDLINGKTIENEYYKVFVKDVIPVKAQWKYTLNYAFLHPLHKIAMSLLYKDGKYKFDKTFSSSGVARILKPVDNDIFLQKIDLINGMDMVEKIYLIKIVLEFEHDTYEDKPEKSSYETYLLYFCHEQVAFFKKFIIEEDLRITYLVTLKRETYPYLTGRVFEYVLGYIGVQYIITRFEEIQAEAVDIFLNDSDIQQIVKHITNRVYILDELSSYRHYETIYKVNYTN